MQATVHLDELHQEEKEAAEPAGTAVAPLEEPIIEGEVTAIIEPEQPTPMRRPYYLIPLCTLLACLIFVAVQNVLPLLTPTVTIFILPKTWTLATTASVQVQGRMLPALTLSQSQTVPATGHGHQEARRARGYVTFYNGSLTEATVPAGTEVTGSEGIRVVTDQSAFIPPASPPSEGQVTVLAHAFVTGTQGNIQAGDIAVALSNDVLAKNLAPFRGGQDERYFTIVSKRDIASAANQLATSLAKIEREALHAQLVDGEGYTPLCADLKTNPDHQIGDEATTVNVTVSETCSAIAYNEHTLHTVVAQ